MTDPAPFHPETALSSWARKQLAKELDVEPDELEFSGVQEGIGYFLLMFNVCCEGHKQHHSTLSVRVDT